jgi:hypothetical protein
MLVTHQGIQGKEILLATHLVLSAALGQILVILEGRVKDQTGDGHKEPHLTDQDKTLQTL